MTINSLRMNSQLNERRTKPTANQLAITTESFFFLFSFFFSLFSSFCFQTHIKSVMIFLNCNCCYSTKFRFNHVDMHRYYSLLTTSCAEIWILNLSALVTNVAVSGSFSRHFYLFWLDWTHVNDNGVIPVERLPVALRSGSGSRCEWHVVGRDGARAIRCLRTPPPTRPPMPTPSRSIHRWDPLIHWLWIRPAVPPNELLKSKTIIFKIMKLIIIIIIIIITYNYNTCMIIMKLLLLLLKLINEWALQNFQNFKNFQNNETNYYLLLYTITTLVWLLWN